MGHPQVVAALVCVGIALSGCASLRWNVQRAIREPGERIEAFPEIVWEEYECDTQQRPHFVLETNELVPPRVEPGSTFNHRLVYALCPDRPTAVVSGRLRTLILFRGEPIVRETTEAYELKPGRWVVDAEVTLPASADPGVYAYELHFESDSVRFDERLTFVVSP